MDQGQTATFYDLTLYHTIPTFNDPKRKPFEKIEEKGENTGDQSHNVFYPIKDRNHYFSNISFVVCKCFEFGPVENFVIS